MDNALNQARKEVGQRYDFKGSKSDVTLNAGEKTLTLVSDDEFKMNALWEIVQTRLVRRGVPIKNFKDGESEAASGGTMVSTVGTNPKVTQGGYKNLYRIIASDNQIGSSMAVYAAKVLKVTKVGVIDDRTAFGQGLAEEFTKEAKKQGLTIVGQEFTTDKAVDFTAILTNMKSKAPEAIFFGGYAPQAAPMARQMKQLAVPGKLLGGDTVCSPATGKLGGDAVNDLVFCAQGGSILEKAQSGPAFKAKFKKRFNVDADAYAASYYDQVMFIGESMQKANSIDPDKVGAELYKTTYKGVAATYAYDEQGNMKQAPITVYTFKNAAPVPLASY